jgi:hypothetical protein
MTTPTPQALLAAATSQIGTKEGPDNATKYGKWFGLDNVSWCAIFVSWCFGQVGGTKLLPMQYRTGFCGCPGAVKSFRERKAFIAPTKAQPGDVAFFDFNDDTIPDHTGIVESVNLKARTITCIEGNTSSGSKGSQANGDGVYRRTRPFSDILGVGKISWPALTSAL